MTTVNIISSLYAIALIADMTALTLLVAKLIVDSIDLKEEERFTVSDFSRRQEKIDALNASLAAIEKEEKDAAFLRAIERIEEAMRLSKTEVVTAEPVDELTLQDLEEMYCA